MANGSTPAVSSSLTGPVGESAPSLNLSTGWWVFFGLLGGILTSETQVAPVTLGLLSVALLYQITQLIEGH
jgi:hypothetical protein